jgi:hypothetical protein
MAESGTDGQRPSAKALRYNNFVDHTFAMLGFHKTNKRIYTCDKTTLFY